MKARSLPDAPDASPAASDFFERLFTRGLWAVASLALLAYVWTFGSPIPWFDDWALVPVFSHTQPFSLGWVWAQQNEHRFPLTKLALYGLGELTHGDYRWGMVASSLVLSLLTLASLVGVSKMRGRASYADAFLPLALLHWGHEQNLLWHIQLFFVGAGATSLAIALLIARGDWPSSLRATIGLGLCLIFLPLHGAMGLACLPALALWAVYAGGSRLRSGQAGGHRIGWTLLGLTLAAVTVSALYFIGYLKVPHHPESPSALASLRTASEVLAGSVGPFGARLWPWSALGIASVGLASGALLVQVIRTRPAARIQALGLLFAQASVVGLILAIGMGRAGFGPGAGLTPRYAVLSVPLLCSIYFTWVLFAPPALGRLVQTALFAVLCVSLSVNTNAGLRFGMARRQQADAFLREVAAGAPPDVLAARHYAHFYPDQEVMAEWLRMLRTAGQGPYRGLAMPESRPCEQATREVPVPPTPSGGHDVTLGGGAVRGTGDDPYVIYTLPDTDRVCAVRLRFTLSSADPAPAQFQAFWARSGRNEFAVAERNWTTMVTPGAAPQELMIWVNASVDRLRLDPDSKPVQFRLLELTMLVPFRTSANADLVFKDGFEGQR